jgi:hypothetical protein
VVRNASNNSDTADCDKAIGELLFDEYLAVHIENLAGGPLHLGRRAVTPNPTTPRGAVVASQGDFTTLDVASTLDSALDSVSGRTTADLGPPQDRPPPSARRW